MSLVALHNGGGVGIGKVINSGFGLVLDGSAEVDDIIRSAMMWMFGSVPAEPESLRPRYRSCYGYKHKYAENYHLTLPFIPDNALIEKTVEEPGKEIKTIGIILNGGSISHEERSTLHLLIFLSNLI